MQLTGLIYLCLYLADGFLSAAALVWPPLEPASNTLSTVQLSFSLMVLIFACVGKLPRKPYLLATGYYMAMFASGLVIMGLAVAKGGTGILKDYNMVTILEQLPWMKPVMWAMTAAYIAVAVYCLAQLRSEKTAASVPR